MILIGEAKKLVWKNTPVLGKERVNFISSLGRVLAEDVVSGFDLPKFDRSAMDGFAIVSEDTISASKKNPVFLEIIGEIKAGDEIKNLILEKGKTFLIMTGAKMPKNCDAVVKLEDVEEVDKDGKKYIKITRSVKIGENVSKKGEDVKKGDVVIKKGTFVDSAVFSMLAYLGKEKVNVYKQPEVAILATGNEIKKVGQKIKEAEIYDANSYFIYALTKKYGGKPHMLGIAKDEPEILEKFVKEGLKYDIFIISGGVSEGKYDIVVDVLLKNKVELVFHKIAVKPGKPTFFGIKNKTVVFGLPGYPVSSYINFENLVKVAIYKMTGRGFPEGLKFSGILKEDVENKGDRDEFLRVVVEVENSEVCITPYKSQKSGVLSSILYSNAVLFLKKGQKISKGQKVVVEILEK